MKKILLIIALAFSFVASAAETEYRPLVEKGKTWWYEITYIFTPEKKHYEFGIRIGEEVEIDGVMWHKCVYVDESLNELAQAVGYVREVDKRVYYYGAPHEIFNEMPIKTLCGFCYDCDFREHVECLIYDFNLKVGETYSNEYSHINYGYTVDEIVYQENSGQQYKVLIDNDAPLTEIIYEGIGCYTDKIGNSLFFCPFEMYAGDMHYRPELRWVTDAENNILFEGRGDTKLWETLSNRDIELGHNATVIGYYDLTGRKIDKPEKGIYIVRTSDGKSYKSIF